jgi:hypothetical protein
VQVANDLTDDIQKTKWGAVYIADADDLLCLEGGHCHQQQQLLQASVWRADV